MKMEYLATRDAECPVIRLYEFTSGEVAELCGLFASLASGTVRTVALHEQHFIRAIQDCHLTLTTAKRDQGIVRGDGESFECLLTQNGWEDERERAQPFVDDGLHGDFVWLLYNIPSEIRLLLSWDGCW